MSKTYRLHLIEAGNEYYTDFPDARAALRSFRTVVVQESTIEATVWRVVDGRPTLIVAHCDNAEVTR